MKKKQAKKTASGKRSAPQGGGWREFAAALAIVLAAIALITLVRFFGSRNPSADGDSTADTSAPPASAVLPEWKRTPIPLDGVSLPLPLDETVSLTALAAADGTFPEDGKDAPCENVLTASFTNTSEQTIEYLTAILTLNGEEYRFAVSTLPPNKTVCAFESGRKTAPASVTSLSAEKEYRILFAEEPSLHADEIRTVIQNGTITVTNASDRAISDDIVVYYKTVYGDSYLGGITYRLRVEGGLKPGESYDGYAPHAIPSRTEVMFIDYE